MRPNRTNKSSLLASSGATGEGRRAEPILRADNIEETPWTSPGTEQSRPGPDTHITRHRPHRDPASRMFAQVGVPVASGTARLRAGNRPRGPLTFSVPAYSCLRPSVCVCVWGRDQTHSGVRSKQAPLHLPSPSSIPTARSPLPSASRRTWRTFPPGARRGIVGPPPIHRRRAASCAGQPGTPHLPAPLTQISAHCAAPGRQS